MNSKKKNHNDVLIESNHQNCFSKCKIVNQTANIAKTPAKRNKRHVKSDLGEHFIAPDGGWGWIVAIATGVSVLVTYPVLQQFGILFRKKFKNIGITSSELTTIINVQQAAAMCSGIFNGPLFRRLSYRQVSLLGNILVSAGLFTAVFANSFISYFIAISLLYGTGRGIMFSSMTLAVNTFFKKKRQEATAYLYAIAGVGAIALPSVCTFLVEYYGVAGTVLLLSGFSLNNFACSAIYQPVKLHVKKVKKTRTIRHHEEDAFSESDVPTVFESCTLEVYNSRISNEKKFLPEEVQMLQKPQNIPDSVEKPSVLKKIVKYFDLGLLRDFGYINIAVGLTLMNIIEINFHYLTPFILAELGLDSSRIAAAMTVQAITDLAMRFLIGLIVARIKLDNRVWLIVGTLGMSLGRVVLVLNRNNIVVLAAFAWMGFCSALRLIFWVLVLPGYVPLKKLPAAIGLQRMIMGISNLVLGPFIGLIRDATNYTFIIHIMNVVSVMVSISWFGQDLFKKLKQNKKVNESTNA